MHQRFEQILRVALLGCALGALSGCDSIRDAAGLNKDAPDEFAVVTKAPLIIPPEYNLRPPQPGAPPTNQLAPTQAAQVALFNGDPNAVANGIQGNYSQGEKLLLAYAGAANANSSIRQELLSDGKSMQGADDSFTSQVLFWQAPQANVGAAVDAEAEAKRVDKQKETGKAGDKPAAKAPSDSATMQKEEKSGWFDWLF
jgi:hypothetical protein